MQAVCNFLSWIQGIPEAFSELDTKWRSRAVKTSRTWGQNNKKTTSKSVSD